VTASYQEADGGPQPASRPDLNVETAFSAPSQSVGITVMGELDIAAVSSLADTLSALANDHARIRADVRELAFCDASGLDLLISTDLRLRARGGGLTLVGPCPPLQFLLDTFGPAVAIELVTSGDTA
jgi:anti-sigma B factor antagonist